jgi:hypothetical protein
LRPKLALDIGPCATTVRVRSGRLTGAESTVPEASALWTVSPNMVTAGENSLRAPLATATAPLFAISHIAATDLFHIRTWQPRAGRDKNLPHWKAGVRQLHAAFGVTESRLARAVEYFTSLRIVATSPGIDSPGAMSMERATVLDEQWAAWQRINTAIYWHVLPSLDISTARQLEDQRILDSLYEGPLANGVGLLAWLESFVEATGPQLRPVSAGLALSAIRLVQSTVRSFLSRRRRSSHGLMQASDTLPTASPPRPVASPSPEPVSVLPGQGGQLGPEPYAQSPQWVALANATAHELLQASAAAQAAPVPCQCPLGCDGAAPQLPPWSWEPLCDECELCCAPLGGVNHVCTCATPVCRGRHCGAPTQEQRLLATERCADCDRATAVDGGALDALLPRVGGRVWPSQVQNPVGIDDDVLTILLTDRQEHASAQRVRDVVAVDRIMMHKANADAARLVANIEGQVLATLQLARELKHPKRAPCIRLAGGGISVSAPEVAAKHIRERGFAVVRNPPRMLHSINSRLATLDRHYTEPRGPGHHSCRREPGEGALEFTPIFQLPPTRALPVNIGNGSRQFVAGVEVGRERDAPQWSVHVAKWQLCMAASLGDLLPSDVVVRQNSLIWSRHDVSRQAGHLDAEPRRLPISGEAPEGVVMLTPLGRATNVWVVPQLEVERLGRLPTVAEFDDLAIEVAVPLGFTVYMRYDAPHAGGDKPGLRLHGLLSASALELKADATYFLRMRPGAAAMPAEAACSAPTADDVGSADGAVHGRELPEEGLNMWREFLTALGRRRQKHSLALSRGRRAKPARGVVALPLPEPTAVAASSLLALSGDATPQLGVLTAELADARLRLTAAIGVLVQHTGARAAVCEAASADVAIKGLASVFRVTNRQRCARVAVAAALGHRIWYAKSTINQAVEDMLGGRKRRSVARHAGALTRILAKLGGSSGTSAGDVMRVLIAGSGAG